MQHRVGVALVIPLKGTPHGTSWRQPCSSCLATKLGPFGPCIGKMSSPGKVLRFVSNWTTYSPGCAGPRQFLWVLALRPYSPGAPLNALACASPAVAGPASGDRLRLGLQGSLIPFAPLAFVHQRQKRPRYLPSPLVFFLVSMDFTPPPGIPVPPSVL